MINVIRWVINLFKTKIIPPLVTHGYINSLSPEEQTQQNELQKTAVMTISTPLQEPTVPQIDTSLDKWGLTPSLKEKALKFFTLAKSKGFDLKITQGFRDPAYQDKLYAQGRTLPGKIVTNATGKTSKHCLGKAFDIAFNGKDPYPKNADWKAIGALGKSCGLIWGGDWKTFIDLLHFEI